MAIRPVHMTNLYEPHGEVATKVWLLLPLRIYVGLYFIVLSIQKVAAGYFSQPTILTDQLRPIIMGEDYPYGFYRAFFEGLIDPYPWLFAFLVVFGELISGLALVAGAFTRVACLVGLFMVLNFNLAMQVDWSKPHNSMSFGVILFVLYITGAGRAYGADHYLRGRVPGWMA